MYEKKLPHPGSSEHSSHIKEWKSFFFLWVMIFFFFETRNWFDHTRTINEAHWVSCGLARRNGYNEKCWAWSFGSAGEHW
jgi:hypothetical protein